MLLPEGFDTFDAFMADLRSKELPARYETMVLVEDHHASVHSVTKGVSMAPYFLFGYHDDLCQIQITYPDEVYAVQVELLDQKEYNARLRELINSYCPGCNKFKPLSNRVQSLNGHFEELPLDGTCLYREEIKPSRRSLRDHLFSIGGDFKRDGHRYQDADRILRALSSWMYMKYESGFLSEENYTRYLNVKCKKKEILSPLVTNALETYTSRVTPEVCVVRLGEPYICTEETIRNLLSDKNRETYRKECKKHGLSLGCLEFDANSHAEITESLTELVKHYWLFPLVEQPGKIWYLVADHSHVLKELRYRAPLLQAQKTKYTEYDQYDNLEYTIGFLMERKQIPNPE